MPLPARARCKALGTYNFAGDIGKMTLPAAASLLFVVLPWREAVALLGGIGVLAAIAIFLLMPRFRDEAAAPRKTGKAGRAGGGIAALTDFRCCCRSA